MTYVIFIFAAIYLGILTSISPCPLATNIAAISYVGKKVESSRSILLGGLLYTLGRCFAYFALVVVLSLATTSLPAISLFFQNYLPQLLGPIFLVLGMFLLGLITFSKGGAFVSEKMQTRVDKMGIGGAFLLGVLFALSFCPTSATFFFGLFMMVVGKETNSFDSIVENLSKIGISPEYLNEPLTGGIYVLPLTYGIGTALPVILVAFLLAFATQHVSRTYNAIGKVERVMRLGTGFLFVALGIWFSLRYSFMAF